MTVWSKEISHLNDYATLFAYPNEPIFKIVVTLRGRVA